MNNTMGDRGSAFPFNFTAGSTYCQNVGSAPSSSSSSQNHQAMSGGNNGQQQQQQQQLGVGVGFDSANQNFNLIQCLLQGTQQQQLHQEQSSSGSGASDGKSWKSCRFCRQVLHATPELLLQHELSCPTHLRVQQFIQAQQQQAQQQQAQHQAQHHCETALQQQLLAQQSQLQQQFKSAQQQGQGQPQGQFDTLSNLSNVFNGSIGQQSYGGASASSMSNGMSSNLFQRQARDLQAAASSSQGQGQGLGLDSLLNQTSSATAQHQQQAFHDQASALSDSSCTNNHDPSSIATGNKDQFESAIDRLPAFEPQLGIPMKDPTPISSYASDPSSTTVYFPLAAPEDEEWLTPLHCFVRKCCVEVFVATADDVAAPCMGKRNPVAVDQVGIRCPYCSPERMALSDKAGRIDVARARENGVVYPSLISRIYNSSINLLQRHLKSCAFVPPEVIARYEELKASNARSGASKKYWADSATRLGLLDTPCGIRLDNLVHKAHFEASQKGGKKKAGQPSSGSSSLSSSPVAVEAPPLVLPSDKRNTTAFTFHLMSQMVPCVFTEADRLGRRRNLEVGFAGLACRHCFGVYGSGRFFPSSVKTMADASKTLDVIYRHVMKCKKCPNDIRGGLHNLRDFHDSERSKMPFGNQRAFFVKIWGRLHEGQDDTPPRVLSARMMAARDMSTPADVGGAASAARSPLAPPTLPLSRPPPSLTVADHSTAMPVAVGGATAIAPKFGAAVPAGGESLQGLMAMLKREKANGPSADTSQNKLATEAA